MQAPRPQLAFRVLSVLPFILFGPFSVIAFPSWVGVVGDRCPHRQRRGNALPPLRPYGHSGGSAPLDKSVG